MRKFNKQYLYDVKMFKDEDNLLRETGKVKFKDLSKEDLVYLFEEAVIKERLEYGVKCQLVNTLERKKEYEKLYRKEQDRLESYSKLVKLLARLIKVNKEDKYNKIFAGIIEDYLGDITYIDMYYDENFDPYWDEYYCPRQQHVNHNKVGSYIIDTKRDNVPQDLINSLEKLYETLSKPKLKDKYAKEIEKNIYKDSIKFNEELIK